MAARGFTPKVVTASDLVHGDVIYLTAAGVWTRELSEAEVLTDEADAQLRLLEAERQTATAVGAYLADMGVGTDGRPRPVHFREEFRRTGPSNYRHGKQERARHV